MILADIGKPSSCESCFIRCKKYRKYLENGGRTSFNFLLGDCPIIEVVAVKVEMENDFTQFSAPYVYVCKPIERGKE